MPPCPHSVAVRTHTAVLGVSNAADPGWRWPWPANAGPKEVPAQTHEEKP